MKALKIAVVVMGVLIVIGVVALIVAIVDRVTGGLTPAEEIVREIGAAETMAMTVDDGRLYLLRRGRDGEERILVLDALTGERITTFSLSPEQGVR